MPPTSREAIAVVGGMVARDLLEVSHEVTALDRGGRWMVSISFEGEPTLARFGDWQRRSVRPAEVGRWRGPDPGTWRSSLSERQYRRAVGAVREHIADGQVYQANLCRTLRAAIHPSSDIVALLRLLETGNPAPYAGALRLPEQDVHIASASPELFLRRRADQVESTPIKGTAASAAGLLAKDEAENIMIVDLVRNDLGRVCQTGTVVVPDLLAVQQHPGLVHLVSTVSGRLRAGIGWPDLLAATFPPGSVSGAPKLAALEIIASLEAGPRGPYCGAFGWVDGDSGTAELAVAIRTFWLEHDAGSALLAFGTGAGITWSSDPGAEWRETELKAARLLRVAGGQEVP